MCKTENFWWIVSSLKVDEMHSDCSGCVLDAEGGFCGSLTVCHAQLHSESLHLLAWRLSGKSALPLSSGQCWREHQICFIWSNWCFPDSMFASSSSQFLRLPKNLKFFLFFPYVLKLFLYNPTWEKRSPSNVFWSRLHALYQPEQSEVLTTIRFPV